MSILPLQNHRHVMSGRSQDLLNRFCLDRTNLFFLLLLCIVKFDLIIPSQFYYFSYSYVRENQNNKVRKNMPRAGRELRDARFLVSIPVLTLRIPILTMTSASRASCSFVESTVSRVFYVVQTFRIT